MNRRVALFLLLASLPLLACRDATRPEPASPESASPTTPAADPLAEEAMRRGQAIVAEAFALLSSNLAQALQTGGVSNALAYCSVQALPLTRVVADTNRVQLRRVTHRTRNPANQADPTEQRLIEQYELARTRSSQPPAPLLVTHSPETLTFYAPITINNPLCLACHGRPGQEILPDHVALLASLYPDDSATGFQFGDLRGLWRVDFDRSLLRDAPSPTSP